MKPAPRSMLFVSGERPDRYAKALAAGADLVCIDLEDAVHPDRKAQARADLMAFLQAGAQPALAVRINAVRTLDGLRDVQALAGSGVSVSVLVVPKVEEPTELALLHGWLGDAFGHLVALLETPLGIEQAATVAAARRSTAPRLAALMLGGADLSMELGARFEWDSLAGARSRLLNAARAHGLQAWDVPFVDVADEAGLRAETRRVRALGYDCKSAIHPSQVAPIHEAFRPDETELAWAQALAAAVEAQGGRAQLRGAFLFQGKLVDAPILERAERLIALANR